MANIDLTGYRATILCEDKAHYEFIRGYLEAAGINRRQITRIDKVFNNDSVKKYYSAAIESHKQYSKENFILIVMTDTDNKSCQDTYRLFDKNSLNKSVRQDKEKTLIFCPARNIESWFYYIDNPDVPFVDEAKDFKNQYINASAKTFGKRMNEAICSKQLSQNAPPSLRLACDELKRLQ